MVSFSDKKTRSRDTGARAAGLSWSAHISAYFANHARALLSTLGKLSAAPFSNIMTSAVIGIALALPAGLYVVLNNLQTVSGGWDSASQISLFTKLSVSDEKANRFADKLRLLPEIESVNYLSKKQAMKEFRSLSGFGEALDALEENPLPAVLIIYPTTDHSTPAQVSLLVEKLHKMPETDLVQLDIEWVKRLYTMMEIGEKGVYIMAILLALAVLLIVGNTIRLDIQNRRDEIIIIKLIGGTDGFIRRPFLYSGLWYGLFGGIIAWLLIEISLGLLAGPVDRLAVLYGSDFSLATLDFSTAITLLEISSALGLAGSWIAVGQHLSEIEPT